MPSQLFPIALHSHEAGNLDRAQALYEEILDIDPRHADTLQLLGVLCHQRGDARRAETMIRQAIAVNPDVAPYHDNLGSVRIEQVKGQALRILLPDPGKSLQLLDEKLDGGRKAHGV